MAIPPVGTDVPPQHKKREKKTVAGFPFLPIGS
jgi:hypothetical protein